MKKLTTLLLTFLSYSVFAQITISGTVYDEVKKPVIGASVYINNTSIGTATDYDGNFFLDVEEGKHDLVISFVGLKTQVYKLDTKFYKNPIKITLISENVLDEIVIGKKLSKSKRKVYMRKFRKLFLGESKFGRSCKILNEDVIEFDVDLAEETFKATATEPIKILHKSFGYVIHYDMVYFKSTPQSLNYFGYTRYDEIDENGRRKEKWLHNRFESYHGSKMHFLRSVLRQRVLHEGFRFDFVDRIPNPDRPTYEEIKKARKFLKTKSGLQRNAFKRSPSLDAEVQFAHDVLERAKLPSHITSVIQPKLRLYEFGFLHEDGRIYLEYPKYLRISHDKVPDKNYPFIKDNPEYTVTMMMLYKNRAFIDEPGVFNKPYDVFLIGYWAFERVGDALPLNYKPFTFK